MTLNEQEKQVRQLAVESGDGEPTPVKFCKHESPRETGVEIITMYYISIIKLFEAIIY